MTGNNASVEVEGPGADTIADNVISSLGLDPDSIDDASITLTVAGTAIEVDATGPDAGDLVAGMMSGVDLSGRDVSAVSATFGSHTEAGDEAGDDADDTRYRPQVEPATVDVDPEFVEFPGVEPSRLPNGTNRHLVGTLLLEYVETTGDDWATAVELFDFAGDDVDNQSMVSSAMSHLFLSDGLTVRRRAKSGKGMEYEYTPTKQLQEEVERLGPHPDVS